MTLRQPPMPWHVLDVGFRAVARPLPAVSR